MADPQVMPPDFLDKVVAEAVVVGYTRGWQARGMGVEWPPTPDLVESMVLEVTATMIHEFGINVHREMPADGGVVSDDQ